MFIFNQTLHVLDLKDTEFQFTLYVDIVAIIFSKCKWLIIPQVVSSSVMKTKTTFFTLSPDGLTQFSTDATLFISVERYGIHKPWEFLILIEDQAFSRSYDLAPPSPLPFRQKVIFFSKSSFVPLVVLTDGKEGGGGGPNSYDGEQAWSSINHSVFSA